MGRGIHAVVVCASLACAQTAHAQGNYRLGPIGGRTTTLGGTGVVYGQDSASAFINPATAVLADENRLSFAVAFYTATFVHAPHWYEPGPVDRSVFDGLEPNELSMNDIAFAAIPSSLCLFLRAADINLLVGKTVPELRSRQARLGICAARVYTESFELAVEGKNDAGPGNFTRQAQTVSQSYRRFAVGPTYAMNVNDHLAIGLSLHATFTRLRSFMESSVTTGGFTASPVTSGFFAASRGDSAQLTGVIGATYLLGHYKLGASFEPPSVHVYGVGGVNQHTTFAGAGTATNMLSAHGSFSSQTPMRLSIGGAFSDLWGLIELNVTYAHRLGSAFSADLDGREVNATNTSFDDRAVHLALAQGARSVLNTAVGVEKHVSRRLSVLSGLSTDFTAVPAGALEGSPFTYFPQRTSRLAMSGGLSSHGPPGDLVVGAELSFGWGQRLAVNSYQLPPVYATADHTTYQLLFTIAGATNLSTIRRAFEDVKEVVSPPKRQ